MGWSRKTVSGLKAKFSGLKYLAFSLTIGDGLKPSPMHGLNAKYFSPKNLAFSPETTFLLQWFWPKNFSQGLLKNRT